MNSCEGEGEENAAKDEPTGPLAKNGRSDDLKASSSVKLAELVKQVTKEDQTEAPLHEKVLSQSSGVGSR